MRPWRPTHQPSSQWSETLSDRENRFHAAPKSGYRLSLFLKLAVGEVTQVQHCSGYAECGPLKLVPHFSFAVIGGDKEQRNRTIEIRSLCQIESR